MHTDHERALHELHRAALTDPEIRIRAVAAIDRARAAAMQAYSVGLHGVELGIAVDTGDAPEAVASDHAISSMLQASTTLAELAYSTLEDLQDAMCAKARELGEQPAPWASWMQARTREQVQASLETARGYVEHLEAELAAMDEQGAD